MSQDTLADRLQVWGFESNSTLFTDGSLGFGLELIPIDISCWDDHRTNGLIERTSQFLNGLPQNTDIQFIQEIGSGNESIVSEHQALALEEAGVIAQSLCQTRGDRILKLDSQGNVPCHRLKIFVRRPLATPLIEKPSFFKALSSKENLFPEVSESALKRELATLEILKSEITQNLDSLGIRCTPILPQDLVDLIYRQWNPSRPIDLGQYDPEDIRNTLLFTDVLINEKGFSLADTHYRILSLKLLPEQTYASMASSLRGLPFGSQLFLSIHVPDQQKELESLQTQRRLAFSMARGKTTGVSDIESESKFQDLETLLAELIAQGEKVFQVSLNVVLKATSEEALELQVGQALTQIRELSGAEAMLESLAAFDIFTEIAIPNARAKERAKRMKTSTLADLLPLFGPWRGHEKPSILLRSRMGSLVQFDPFPRISPIITM